MALNEHGLCLLTLGRPKDAVRPFSDAASIWEHIGDRTNHGTAVSNLAISLVNQGLYGDAIHLLKDVTFSDYGSGAEESNRLNALITLSAAQIYSADYKSALSTLRTAESEAKAPEFAYQLAGVDSNYGFAYIRTRQLDEAEARFSEAASLYESKGYLRGAAYATNGRCQSLLLRSRPDAALDCFVRAISQFSTVPDATLNAVLRLNAGLAMEATGQCRGALDSWLDSVAIARRAELYEIEGRAFGAMTLCLETAVSRKAAILAGLEAVSIFGDTRANLERLERTTGRSFVQSKQDVYRRVIKMLVDEGNIAQAEEIVRDLKDEEYFEFTRGEGTASGTSAGRNAQVVAAADAASQSIAELGLERRELQDVKRTRPLSAAEQARENYLDAQLRAVRVNFFSRLDSLAKAGIGNAVSTVNLRYLDSFRGTLGSMKPETVLLTYVVSPTQVIGILTTADTQIAKTIEVTRQVLNSQVFAFRQAISDWRTTPKAQALTLSRQLYGLLVAPFDKDLRGLNPKTIMLSLDGVLRYVPFSALSDGKSFLLDRYALALYTPAAAVNLKDEPRHSWRVAGLGVTKAIGGFRTLPYVPDELAAIVRAAAPWDNGMFPGEICVDECFTDARIRAILNAGYPVLHIASHFVFKPGNEAASFLLLGDGSELTLREIRDSDLSFAHLDLLTLSACETAIGADDSAVAGAEVEGFAVLAQNQGAKGVVATLWPAFDRSTADLMAAFYKGQVPASRVNKAEAMRLAQLSIRSRPRDAGEPDFTHPFFWAPFIVVGNWR
jgi:CHAT domain-containing protein